MDQATANEKISDYGALLLLDAPPEMQFGIDNQFWKIGPLFKGVKLIPPGAHYVYFSLQDEDYAARMGFFINVLERATVIVRKWSNELQEFSKLSSGDELAYQEGVRNFDFDKFLGAYPMENFDKWRGLANFISHDVITRIEPSVGNHLILSNQKETLLRGEEMKSDIDDHPKSEASDPQTSEDIIEQLEKQVAEEERLQRKENRHKFKYQEVLGSLNFIDIPMKKVVHGVTGANLTKLNFDKSFILEEMLQAEYAGNSDLLLGELQFAFITFLLGENLESFEQWKRIIVLLCHCEDALKDPLSTELFFKFIPLLYQQIQQLPQDFFTDELSHVNFLTDSFNVFFELCDDETVSPKIRSRAEKLREMLTKDYNLTQQLTLEQRLEKLKLDNKLLEDENDEDLPVVVDLNEQFVKLD